MGSTARTGKVGFAMLRSLVQSENWDEILEGKSLPVYDKPREQAWALGHGAGVRPQKATARQRRVRRS